MLLAFALILSSLSSLAFAATEEQPANGANLALNKTTTASGTEASTSFYPQNATDGDMGTRWSHDGIRANPPRWLKVDLGETMTFRQFKIFWEAAYASGYQIQYAA